MKEKIQLFFFALFLSISIPNFCFSTPIDSLTLEEVSAELQELRKIVETKNNEVDNLKETSKTKGKLVDSLRETQKEMNSELEELKKFKEDEYLESFHGNINWVLRICFGVLGLVGVISFSFTIVVSILTFYNQKKIDDIIKTESGEMKTASGEMKAASNKMQIESGNIEKERIKIEGERKMITDWFKVEKQTIKKWFKKERKSFKSLTKQYNEKMENLDEKVRVFEEIIPNLEKKIDENAETLKDFQETKEDIDIEQYINRSTELYDTSTIPEDIKNIFRNFQEKFRKVEEGNENFEFEAQDYFAVGLFHYYDKEYSKALPRFIKALNLEYKNKEQIYTRIAGCYFRRIKDKNIKVAYENIEKAIEANPKYAPAWYNKGQILKHEHKHQKAIEAYEAAIKIEPKHFLAKNNIGTTLITLKEYEEAVSVLEELIREKKNYYTGHFNLACAYAMWAEKEVNIEKKENHIKQAIKNLTLSFEDTANIVDSIFDSELSILNEKESNYFPKFKKNLLEYLEKNKQNKEVKKFLKENTSFTFLLFSE